MSKLQKYQPFILILFVSFVFGWVVTSTQYSYGTGDQVTQLPIVLRAINPSYLSNDFYVNATQEYGPRSLYALLLSTLSRVVSTTTLYFLVTFLVNAASCLATILITRKLFNNSNFAGLISGILFFSITFTHPVALNPPNLYFPILIARATSFPILLFAIFSSLYQKPLYSALLAGIASLLHPQLGIILGWILFFTTAATHLTINIKSEKLLKGLVRFIPAFLVLVIFSMVYFLPAAGGTHLDDQVFFNIYARFRVPHHILPSVFPLDEFLEFFMTLVALFWAWRHWWKQSETSQFVKINVTYFIASILLLCLFAGYFLVEIFPTRIGASIQAFRFLIFVNWFTVVLIAGWIDQLFSQTRVENKLQGYLFLLSALTPLTLFISTTLCGLREFFAKTITRYFPNPAPIFGQGLDLLIISSVLIYINPPIGFLTSFFIFILIFYYLTSRAFYKTLPVFLLCTLLLGISQTTVIAPTIINRIFHPRTTLALNYPLETIELGKMIKNTTPEDTIILTPPNFGELRFLADRAIVVDFKSMVFQEPELKTWYERLMDCYGPVGHNGFDSIGDMESNYGTIKDEKLSALRDKYNISYALLFVRTPSDFPVVFKNKSYKLVSLIAR